MSDQPKKRKSQQELADELSQQMPRSGEDGSRQPGKAAPQPGAPAETGAEGEPVEDVFDASGAAPEDREERLNEQLFDVQGQLLRAKAELENYRKRVQRQIEEERKYASLPLVSELLPVIDNIERALAASEKAGEAPQLLQGFRMVAEQFENTLRQFGCKRVEPLGSPFDPHLHEAMAQTDIPDHEPGTVVQVVRPGYVLHDRVVRPAQVIVAKRPDEHAEQ